MSEGLKPCPFCGEDDLLVVIGGQVVCQCGARGSLARSDAGAVGDWNDRAPDAAARTEARAAQAEADARLMLAVVYEIGVDLSVDIVMSMADHGLTDEERIACGDLVATHAGAGPDALLAIMRRILATAGGT